MTDGRQTDRRYYVRMVSPSSLHKSTVQTVDFTSIRDFPSHVSRKQKYSRISIFSHSVSQTSKIKLKNVVGICGDTNIKHTERRLEGVFEFDIFQ
jgi:hypothetical protein